MTFYLTNGKAYAGMTRLIADIRKFQPDFEGAKWNW
jgi:hypothetical protein